MQKNDFVKKKITLKSSAFNNGDMIPKKYTCEGENMSPPLYWDHVSPLAKSLVLICHDPDAPSGDWVHWLVYDIPATVTSFKEDEDLSLYKIGLTSWGSTHQGYNGPCPPSGMHHYIFDLYAIDKEMVGLPAGIDKNELLSVIKEHILEKASLMSTYQKGQ